MVDRRSPSSFSCSDGLRRHCVGRSVGRSVDGRSPISFSCSDGPRRHCVRRSIGKSVEGRSPSSFSCSDGPRRHCVGRSDGRSVDSTKALKKKDALLKPDFDSLPVVGETKLKKGFKALVLSFHSRRRAAL